MIYRVDGPSQGQTNSLGSSRSTDKSPSSKATTEVTNSPAKSTVDTPLLASAQTAVNASDGIDRQKVDAIKNAIRNGEFTVDANRVAAAFVDLEMLTGS